MRRAKLIEMLGGKCVSCGTKKNLEFDHIKKKNKTMDISNSIDTNEAKLIKEIKKCQLLCRPCHVKKTNDAWDYAVDKTKHGSIWMYKKYKCRCQKCREAMSRYYHNKLDVVAQRFALIIK